MKVRFTKIDKVNINLYQGNSIRNMTLIQDAVALQGQTYELPEGQEMIITVVPQRGKYYGRYEWEYWVDGEPYGYLERKYNEFFKKSKNGDVFLAISITCAALLIIIFFVFIFICIRFVLRKCCYFGSLNDN